MLGERGCPEGGSFSSSPPPPPNSQHKELAQLGEMNLPASCRPPSFLLLSPSCRKQHEFPAPFFPNLGPWGGRGEHGAQALPCPHQDPSWESRGGPSLQQGFFSTSLQESPVLPLSLLAASGGREAPPLPPSCEDLPTACCLGWGVSLHSRGASLHFFPQFVLTVPSWWGGAGLGRHSSSILRNQWEHPLPAGLGECR